MSTVRPEDTGTSRKTRWRVILPVALLLVLAVTVAAFFVSCQASGSAAEDTGDVPAASPEDPAPEAEVSPSSGPDAQSSDAPPVVEEDTQDQLVTYTTADGMLQFDHPSGWTVRELSSPARDVYNQTTDELEIVNKDGVTMGELITGVVAGFMQLPGVPYYEFDYEPLTGLEDKEPERGDIPAFVFQALEQPAGFDAQMAITAWGRDNQTESAVLVHGFGFIPGVSGAFFSRPIAPDTVLPVDPSLTGANRLEAYMQTREYADVKQMMMSLRFVP